MTSSERWKMFGCFILIHLAAFSGSATEIRLKSRVESRGSVVLLGDIADLKAGSGEATTDSDAADRASLARLELFPSPGISRSRTVRRRELRELLGLHGVDLKALRFTGAESVLVRTSQRPQLGKIAPAAHSATVSGRAAFATAKPIAAADPETSEPATELVLAPIRGLRRGEIIRASNVALIPVPLSGKGSASSLGIQPALHTEEVIGMAATRSLAPNQPLDMRILERPLVVRRGDLVTVTSLAPGVRVETVARAVDAAALGDLVVLESIVNRKKYTARATGTKTAEVFASGIRVSNPAPPQTDRKTTSSLERRAAP